MKQHSLGIDIVSIERVERILERTPSFATRMFSEQECAYCNARPRPAAHFAARFAAKEAVVKAMGVGFAKGIHPRDIEVESGAHAGKTSRPKLVLHGRALAYAEELGIKEFPLSLSHTATDAVACAIAIGEERTVEEEPAQVSTDQLVQRFKEMRGMLDELDT